SLPYVFSSEVPPYIPPSQSSHQSSRSAFRAPISIVFRIPQCFSGWKLEIVLHSCRSDSSRFLNCSFGAVVQWRTGSFISR
ncbi:hypothetical protein PENTCL1PPCAC_5981, partial [Pristionchus entomophagus]